MKYKLSADTLAVLEQSWDYVVKREYGAPIDESLWGLPQGVMWTLRKEYWYVTQIGVQTRFSVDGSAIAPLNLSSGRLHDLAVLRHTYASKRFMRVYHALADERGPVAALLMASLAAVPEPILDERTHTKYWKNAVVFTQLEQKDYFPIVFEKVNESGIGLVM
jgi:hypothetical protein